MNSLPAIDTARLPETYQAAQRALAECSRIDECQQWADKAEAMASYAKQAKDETLRKLADRIQARAIRRCGELLKQIPDQRGSHWESKRDGTVPSIPKPDDPNDLAFAHVTGSISSGEYQHRLTRAEAAEQAGLSERQRKTAIRVASVPLDDFTAAVESDNPPTVTQLAERGKQTRLVDLCGIPPDDYARATEAQGTLRRFAEFCSRHDAGRIAKAFKSHETKALRECVATVDAWLDQFVVNLSE